MERVDTMVLSRGLGSEEIASLKDLLNESSQKSTVVVEVSLEYDETLTEDFLKLLLSNEIGQLTDTSSTDADLQVFLIEAGGKKQALKVIDKIKKNFPAYRSAAFAIITKTGKRWSLGKYFKEVALEHKGLTGHGSAKKE